MTPQSTTISATEWAAQNVVFFAMFAAAVTYRPKLAKVWAWIGLVVAVLLWLWALSLSDRASITVTIDPVQ